MWKKVAEFARHPARNTKPRPVAPQRRNGPRFARDYSEKLARTRKGAGSAIALVDIGRKPVALD